MRNSNWIFVLAFYNTIRWVINKEFLRCLNSVIFVVGELEYKASEIALIFDYDKTCLDFFSFRIYILHIPKSLRHK